MIHRLKIDDKLLALSDFGATYQPDMKTITKGKIYKIVYKSKYVAQFSIINDIGLIQTFTKGSVNPHSTQYIFESIRISRKKKLKLLGIC